jgi:uncharacterized membrane protein YqjE
MNRPEYEAGGWGASLRRLAGSLLGLAQNRFELFAVEFQEERLRALDLVIWLCLALALGTAGLLLGLGALAYFLWSTTGYFGVVGLALAALAGAAIIVLKVRKHVETSPAPFPETIGEFKKDRECLLKNN